jgi:multidrug efflux system membrane fusion protein
LALHLQFCRDRARASLAALLLVASSVIGVSGCTDSKSANEKKAVAAPAPVTVTRAERRNVPLTVTAIGNVVPIESVAIKSRIDGQIVAVHVGDGHEVHKGQRLFDLDARYLQAQLKQLEAQEARDRALLANARSLEKRYTELQARGFVSEEALTQARTGREAAEATVSADRAAVETARVQLSYSRIDAPIGGRVGRIHLPVGNTVRAADAEPLLVINKLAPIYVSFAVPERYLGQVKAAQGSKPLPVAVRHEGADATSINGQLSFIDNAVDQQTGTIRLNATFANEDRRLWPGQFVTATLVLREQPNALVVPSQAIQNGPNGPYVYVVKQDQSADLRRVSVERTEGLHSIIAKGLEAGEVVVISGQLRVTPGAKVAVRQG